MKSIEGTNIGFLGGDERERILINFLEQEGAFIYAIGQPSAGIKAKGNLELNELIEKCELFIAPMSGTDNKGNIKAPFTGGELQLNRELFNLLGSKKPLLIGMVPDHIESLAREMGTNLIVTGKMDELAILNAIPTAEGAIQIAMEKLPKTIFNLKVLILGMGRVGRPLARRLMALGAEVYCLSKCEVSLAWSRELGCRIISYEKLTEYLPHMELVFNTVPALILEEKYLTVMSKDTLIVDLASPPGGVDLQAAKKLGIEAHLCLGLPGKTAPRTAGEILCQVYSRLLGELIKKQKEDNE